MSHSYKKTPYTGDKNKFMKKYANRRIRRKKLNHNYQYNVYKKHTESWDICDFKYVNISFQKYWEHQVWIWIYCNELTWWCVKYSFPDYEEIKKQYYKTYIRK